MRYERLEEAGLLEIEYTGIGLNVYALGVLQINLQDITEKVANWLLSNEGLLEPSWRRPRYLPPRAFLPPSRLVNTDVVSLKAGSLLESVTFSVAVVLSDADVRAVLQNLAATIIWAVGSSGVRGIREKPSPPADVHPRGVRRRDPIEIGPNLREVIVALVENAHGDSAELRFKHDRSSGERVEVVIRIKG